MRRLAKVSGGDAALRLSAMASNFEVDAIALDAAAHPYGHFLKKLRFQQSAALTMWPVAPVSSAISTLDGGQAQDFANCFPELAIQ